MIYDFYYTPTKGTFLTTNKKMILINLLYFDQYIFS